MKRALRDSVILFLVGIPVSAQEPAQKHESADHASADQSPASPDKIWADLMAGNRRFVAGTPQARDLVRLRKASRKSNIRRLSCSPAQTAGCSRGAVRPESRRSVRGPLSRKYRRCHWSGQHRVRGGTPGKRAANLGPH